MTLGWILSGPTADLSANESNSEFMHHRVVLETLDRESFWKIEEVLQKAPRSLEEQQCEKHFRATHSQTSKGRYVVRLPFRNGSPISLGDSHSTVLSNFYCME